MPPENKDMFKELKNKSRMEWGCILGTTIFFIASVIQK